MRVIVLGAAAGGGLPQWNCGCANCRAARQGGLAPQTQASLAVGDSAGWILLDASPDLRQQIEATPALHPRAGRDTPIVAVLLTGGDIDRIAGLLTMREGQAFALYATPRTFAAIADTPLFGVLDRRLVSFRPVPPGQTFAPMTGLAAAFFAVPGKVPLWQEGLDAGEAGDTVGIALSTASRRMAYVPCCAAVTPALLARLDGADPLFFDGTLFHDDELLSLGLGARSGKRMGHLAMAGPDGSMAALAGLRAGRRFFIHVNNSNPAWMPGSPAAAALADAGWRLAHDGQDEPW